MDPEIQRQMAEFEAARIARPIELRSVTPRRFLAIRDGSDQDATVATIASALADRFDGETGEWNGSPHDLAHESILAAAEAADLLVSPCPFGADFELVGTDTLSTTMDLVLTRSPVPVLLVRAPVEDARATLRHPLVVADVCA